MKVLSKSRFKLGLECPNKLFFVNKPEYANQKEEDSFLEALAQGGFQVEELARLHYPNGILIDSEGYDYQKLHDETRTLLQQDDATIYEAAFLHDHLFIRSDIIFKRGTNIKLVEVKSKSYDPDDPNIFIGKKGGLDSKWKPYLFDIAFQKYVISQAYPDLTIESFILMADKSLCASINGLNQLFRISKDADNRTGIITKVEKLEETGDPVLSEANVSDIVEGIIEGQWEYAQGLNFQKAIGLFNEHYQKDQYISWPTRFTPCRNCEFRTSEDSEELKSGIEHCFTVQHEWEESEFEKPTIMDISNYHYITGQKLFDQKIFFMDQLDSNNFNLENEEDRLSQGQRQWIQVRKELNNDQSIHVDVEGLKKEMDTWILPLHFIDFETSSVALPFHQGRRPYEQTAFQFSHHVVHENGTIEHRTEFLETTTGVFPNFEFLRNLKSALSNDSGSIFRYADHENTIVNAIHKQLVGSEEDDKDELLEFIETISHSTKEAEKKWEGERDMIDLYRVLQSYYYNPSTKGSYSMKKILPAILNSSQHLQGKYSKPIMELNLTSKNFPDNHVWIKEEHDKFVNPYKILPRLFDDWTDDQLDTLISDMESLADGGAAMTAYAKLQFTEMEGAEKEALICGLLKYCELDTLAMVMVWEHLMEYCNYNI